MPVEITVPVIFRIFKLQLTVSIYEEEESDDDDAYSDKKWREKLAAEADMEFAEHMGKFLEPEEVTYGREETYDDWADRIYRAFSDRRRQV